ncbi:MAG: prephenate dehydrogenase/arogenate dehydrogenase family protein [Microthrixaceae bacterium]|nr:prephenate dehydrogenase/arogenate dehydrogenase family protein [Microthrixaceae bacterium]
MSTSGEQRRAQIIGTGLIGGSVGLGLRAAGWHVSGTDRDPETATAAVAVGALDQVGSDPAAHLVVIALPVGAVAAAARGALRSHPHAVITDVGSVKAAIVEAVGGGRFVGGHPMAGSEQEGIAGSSATMFRGATWVLTPVVNTDPEAYATVHSMVGSLGAEVVTLDPGEHDSVVAVISHVPHLTAATLMRLAAGRADRHGALLRLAAGGFRDMTRIASGHPGIWPDICAENRDAIVSALDELIDELGAVRSTVASSDRARMLGQLDAARQARLNLPTTAPRAEALVELRVPVSDEPGRLAAVTTLATQLAVNIYDIELAHSAEGPRGVMILVIAAEAAAAFVEALDALGYRSSTRSLG